MPTRSTKNTSQDGSCKIRAGNRNSSDTPTSVLSEAWRLKKCRSLKRPQHGSGRLWVEGLSTAAAPRTGLLPSQPPKMYIPSAASLHTAVCSSRAVGAVPLKVTSDQCVACCRQLWLETEFGIQVWEMFTSTRRARNPTKFHTKTELRKKHGIKSCISCHTLHFAFGW